MSVVIALRLFRPPLGASVTLREAKPVRLRCLEREDIAGEIVWTAGPWRSSGDWSEQEGWSREEWDIAVSAESSCQLPVDPVKRRRFRHRRKLHRVLYSTNNLIGLGETVSLSAQLGTVQRSVQLGFTEPYFLDRPMQVGFTVFIPASITTRRAKRPFWPEPT